MGKPRPDYSPGAFAIRRAGIQASPEFLRVFHLPRRQITTQSVDVQAWTNALKTKHGSLTLLFDQALALAELAHVGGLFVAMEAGSGKTLIGLLAATILNAQCPIYLCPPAGKKQLEDDIVEMSHHFNVSKKLKVFTYGLLSSPKQRELLRIIQPDLIICDEAQVFKNPDSGRGNRFYEYLELNPFCRVVPMTGTPTVRDIVEFGPMLVLALRHLAPVPLTREEMVLWGNALGSAVSDDMRIFPGALTQFASLLTEPEREGITDPLTLARLGFGRRLLESPGVIYSSQEALKIPIYVRFPRVAPTAKIVSIFEKFRRLEETPDGESASDGWEATMAARQLVCGFSYRWVWPNDVVNQKWKDARKAFNKYCREKTKEKELRLDTRGLVEAACFAHESYELGKKLGIPLLVQRYENVTRLNSPAYRAWRNVKDEYDPVVATDWHDTYLLDEVQRWLEKNHGVAWIEHVAFGEALAARGIPYYGGGADDFGKTEKGSCAASIKAHHYIKNLQTWHRALYVLPPTAGDIWEQSLARFHRKKQKAEHVTADVFVLCSEAHRAMMQALEDARYATQLGKPQRLMRAKLDGLLTDYQIFELHSQGNPLWG